MKKSFLVLLSVAMLVSCHSRSNSGTANSDSTSTSTSTAGTSVSDTSKNIASNTKWDQNQEKDFVQKAALGGLMEVQLGQTAQKRAMSKPVKGFGKMMVTDHTDANNKLKTAVQSLQLTVPSALDKDHQDKVDNLKNKSGKDFDKEYMDMMVSDHQEDVSNFEKAQDKISTPQLKTWVDNTLPVLRKHLTEAQNIQQQMKESK